MTWTSQITVFVRYNRVWLYFVRKEIETNIRNYRIDFFFFSFFWVFDIRQAWTLCLTQIGWQGNLPGRSLLQESQAKKTSNFQTQLACLLRPQRATLPCKTLICLLHSLAALVRSQPTLCFAHELPFSVANAG
jgi:hypothetical protein